MKECPNCAMDVPDAAAVCSICRYEFPRRRVLSWKPVVLILLLALLVPLVLVLVRALDGSL